MNIATVIAAAQGADTTRPISANNCNIFDTEIFNFCASSRDLSKQPYIFMIGTANMNRQISNDMSVPIKHTGKRRSLESDAAAGIRSHNSSKQGIGPAGQIEITGQACMHSITPIHMCKKDITKHIQVIRILNQIRVHRRPVGQGLGGSSHIPANTKTSPRQTDQHRQTQPKILAHKKSLLHCIAHMPRNVT